MCTYLVPVPEEREDPAGIRLFLLSFMNFAIWCEVDFRQNTVFVREFSYFEVSVNSPVCLLNYWYIPYYSN